MNTCVELTDKVLKLSYCTDARVSFSKDLTGGVCLTAGMTG
jgi:hypothetical protein